MESTIIQTSNPNDQGIPCQQEGGNQGRTPSSFYQQAPRQPPSPRREEEEKELEKTIFPRLQDSKIQKDAMDNVFNMARTLMEFKDKEEQIMRQPHLPRNNFVSRCFKNCD
ncbi:hypothetical protein O181_112971 [Austropuccinia psidii MF-1]|uniref:Uncharacterized protein n=1 Tax=Austropuccinia psidii MF-1 TaxID=1389203 RepID=A0A9Q3K3E4_9BASI|nr:hypothetical protein [Austropuccinia psidii MF-1]